MKIGRILIIVGLLVCTLSSLIAVFIVSAKGQSHVELSDLLAPWQSFGMLILFFGFLLHFFKKPRYMLASRTLVKKVVTTLWVILISAVLAFGVGTIVALIAGLAIYQG